MKAFFAKLSQSFGLLMALQSVADIVSSFTRPTTRLILTSLNRNNQYKWSALSW
ncbi:hypothetical protein M9194_19390 [Vibrio sp. S4M6]|uniref:hypothetical protein n=1 Tax=Vibrio sinus TaxID=2946865 RepID=UPI00202A7152|nr:hypothetical protein [Vibrio sinus]MCL9783591.1 hypothetical protein [Vibrio sinus]